MGTKRRIKYGFKIDQAALYNAGIRGVDCIDLAIYEFICGMFKNDETHKLLSENRVFVLVYTDTIAEQMPYLSRRGALSGESICRRISNLVDCGLLTRHPDNQRMGKTFYAPSSLAHAATMTVEEDEDWREISKRELDTSDEFDRGGRLNMTEGVGQICPTITNKNKLIRINSLEKENAHVREENPEQGQPLIAAPEKRKTTLDFQDCEGHGIKVAQAGFPKQPNGAPYPHPDIVLELVPFAKRIDLWWSLYGINQGRTACEMMMIRNDFANEITFAALYRHTFLYVAVTDPHYRKTPKSYLQDKAWLDDITDRRTKPKNEPPSPSVTPMWKPDQQ